MKLIPINQRLAFKYGGIEFTPLATFDENFPISHIRSKEVKVLTPDNYTWEGFNQICADLKITVDIYISQGRLVTPCDDGIYRYFPNFPKKPENLSRLKLTRLNSGFQSHASGEENFTVYRNHKYKQYVHYTFKEIRGNSIDFWVDTLEDGRIFRDLWLNGATSNAIQPADSEKSPDGKNSPV